MKLQDLIMIKEKIETEYNMNNEKIKELDDKLNVIRINNTGDKLIRIGGFSMFTFMVLLVIVNKMALSIVAFPLELFSYFTIGTSLLIGGVVERLFAKKIDLSERLKEFSNAQTKKEKLEEEVIYSIEKAQLLNKNKILKMRFDYLNSTVDQVKNEAHNVDISINFTDRASGINESELNQFTAKGVLYNTFFDVRNNSQKNLNLFLNSMIGGVLFTLLFDMPLIVATSVNPLLHASNILNVLVPFVIGSAVIGGFIAKDNSDRLDVFRKINYKFWDRLISEKEFSYEEKLYEKSLDKVLETMGEVYSTIKIGLTANDDIKTSDYSYSFDKQEKNIAREFDINYVDQRQEGEVASSSFVKKKVKEDL